jgi:carbon-monoxide dehydrogenase large subunit/6-hydroxypseudooxynicotine dehydrogenase subunit gamma
VGIAVNPMLVEGQIVGGMVQGLGGALFEEFVYDDNGTPLAVTFADYLMPTAREVPDVEFLLSEDAPSPLNPLGVKGAGEGGTIPAPAAIISAVEDALAPFGVRFAEMPLTPDRIVDALCRAGAYATRGD